MEGKNPGQGGHSPRPAAPHLCRKTAGGWAYPVRLQHPEGIHAPPCPAPPGWTLKHESTHASMSVLVADRRTAVQLHRRTTDHSAWNSEMAAWYMTMAAAATCI